MVSGWKLSQVCLVIGSIYVFNVHNAESISLCDATFLASGSSESKRESEAYNVDKQKADKVLFVLIFNLLLPGIFSVLRMDSSQHLRCCSLRELHLHQF